MDKWVLPVNVKRYDIVNYLKTMDTFVWKAKKHFKKNDIIYVYATSPIQEIRYKCKCINESVSKDILEEHEYAKEPGINRYAMFQIEKSYPEGLLTWSELHENGLGQALLPSRVYVQLEAFIDKKESSYTEYT